MIRRASLVAVAILAAAPQAAAQLPGIFPTDSRWDDLFYPKVLWTPRDGFTAGLFYSVVLPPPYRDDTPAPYAFRVALDAQASTTGSRFAELDVWAPALVDGWRFRATFAAEHWSREPYFGIGNASSDDTPPGAGSLFHRITRVRNMARGEVQRRVVGPLRLLVGWHAEHWFLDTLETPSRLELDRGAGAASGIGVGTDDVSLRVGAVFDTRDREAAPQQGIVVEVLHSIADQDVAGDLTYTRTTVSARGYLHLNQYWGLAARVVGESMGGTPQMGSYFRIESSDRSYEGLGGPETHRGLYRNRFLGADKLLGNFEVRYAVLPYFLRTVAVAFLDVGRVFPPGELELTTDGLKAGGGVGLFVHFLSETAVLGATFGVGPDGVTMLGHWRWTF